MQRTLAKLGAVTLLPSLCHAQTTAGLPEYKPEQEIHGSISAWGAEGMKGVMARWQTGFQRYHPDVTFQTALKSTATGIAGLYAADKDLGVMAREIWPIESLAFQRVFGYEPLGIIVVTGAYDVEDKTFPLVVFVHDGNPIQQLSFAQLKAIFGCGSCDPEPGVKAVRTWGDLGATGAWANKPIHTYGYTVNSGFAFFFDHTAMDGSGRWNCGMKTFDTIDTPGKPRNAGGARILQAMANDPDGIAISGIRYPTAGTHPVAIAATDAGPYVLPTKPNVANRTYPLTRSDYIFINRKPGEPVDPKVSEFLRYVLSKQGQEEVVGEGDFLPLPPALAAQQLKLLQ
jgi:phosphate transport system substrate-binding protein